MAIIKKKNKPSEGMVEHPTLLGKIYNIFNTLLLAMVIFVCIIPLWHALMSSFSNGQALMAKDGLVLWPVGGFNLGGYKLLFRDNNIIKGYLNTIIYVGGTTALGFILNVLGGYVLSRPTKLKPILSLIVVFSMLFGGGLIPSYMVVKTLGMVGTRWAVIIPSCTNGMFIILIMNAFMQVPYETVESAKIDGAGHVRLMFNIMLPQAMGLSLVTIINTAIMSYNAWFEATIYVPTQKNLWPLQLWIKELTANNEEFLNYANPDFNRYLIQFAVIIISVAPILIALPFFQEKLEKNMVVGAVKG